MTVRDDHADHVDLNRHYWDHEAAAVHGPLARSGSTSRGSDSGAGRQDSPAPAARRLLRSNGFMVEDLIEIHAPRQAPGTFPTFSPTGLTTGQARRSGRPGWRT